MDGADPSAPLYVLWLGDHPASLPRANVVRASPDLSAQEIADLAPDLVVLAGEAARRASSLAHDLARVRSDIWISIVSIRAGARIDPAVLDHPRPHEGHAGLLVGETAIVIDARGQAAPDRGATHGSLRFAPRPPGRVRILRRGGVSDGDPGGGLEGARIVSVGVDTVAALEARGAQVAVLREPDPIEARANDPTVLVIEPGALSAEGFALAIADDPRLSSASLLVVDGNVPADQVIASAALLAQHEVELGARAARGALVIDRIEALGMPRWLKVAARGNDCTLAVRAREGAGEINLSAGKIKDATFEGASGRDAIHSILALTNGTVLLGASGDVARGRPLPRTSARASEPLVAKVDETHELVRASAPPAKVMGDPLWHRAPAKKAKQKLAQVGERPPAAVAPEKRAIGASALPEETRVEEAPRIEEPADERAPEPAPGSMRWIAWAALGAFALLGAAVLWDSSISEPEPERETSLPEPEEEPFADEPAIEEGPLPDPIEPGAVEEEPPTEPIDVEEPPPAPVSEDLLAELALAREARRWPRVQELAARVLTEDPTNVMAALWLAWSHAKQQRYEPAVEWARRARALAPLDGDPMLLEGDIHWRFGYRALALEVWQACVDRLSGFGPCASRLERGVQ